MPGYWDNIVREIFPNAINISENWNKCTISFELKNINTTPIFVLNPQTLQKMVNKFGDKYSIAMTAYPVTLDYQTLYFSKLQITILDVIFPTKS